MEILDVGCGSRPRGNVNVDLRSPKYTRPKRHLHRKPRDIENFVLASAEHLPFKDAAFPLVVSYHTIEHVEKPVKMLRELIRVSNSTVEIKCPHRLRGKSLYHRNYFNITWFKKFLANQSKVEGFYIDITKWRPFPNSFLALSVLPSEITIQINVCTQL